jgi:hypothetical protein
MPIGHHPFDEVQLLAAAIDIEFAPKGFDRRPGIQIALRIQPGGIHHGVGIGRALDIEKLVGFVRRPEFGAQVGDFRAFADGAGKIAGLRGQRDSKGQ